MKIAIVGKLVVSLILFVVPVGYLIYSLIAQQQIAIDFATKELQGNHYLDAMRTAQMDHWLGRLSGGDVALSLAQVEREYGKGLNSSEFSLRAQSLLRDGRDKTATAAALRELTARVGDQSNLILDPDLDSYYSMDVVLLKVPDIIDQIATLTAATKGTLSTEEKVNLLVARGALSELVSKLDGSVRAGYRGNPDGTLKRALDPAYLEAAEALRTFLVGVQSIGEKAAPAIDGVATLRAVDALGETASVELGRLVQERIDEFVSNRVTTLLATALLFGIATLGVSLLLRYNVVRPLSRLTKAMLALADGNLEAEVPRSSSHDEVAALADAMARFKEKLGASRSLSETVVQSTLQVSVATGQASTAVAQVSGGARNEMGAVARLRDVFAATQATMKQVEALTVAGLDRSQAAAQRLIESRTDIEAMVDAVHAISGMSREINRVTQAINKLAAHSNILSLNASIEASRAGEHGRGFAVVASAVGSLAQQTLALSREIAQLAQDSDEQIQRGVTVATAVDQRMKETTASISETDRLSQAIVGEVARQRDSLAGVEAALQDLTQISQANATAAEEISVTMQSLSELTDDTRRQAERVMAGKARRYRALLADAELIVDGQERRVTLHGLAEDGATVAGFSRCLPGAQVTLILPNESVRVRATVGTISPGGLLDLRFTDGDLSASLVDQIAKDGIARLIDMAKAEHRACVARIGDAVSGVDPLTPADLPSHHSCRFGQWYDNVTDEALLALPAFRDLLEPHRQFHAVGRDILVSLLVGDDGDARSRLLELEGMSQRIIERLDRLGAEATRPATA